MSHSTIIIHSNQPPDENSSATIRVEFRPPDTMTPEEIGAEVCRVVKLVRKIEHA